MLQTNNRSLIVLTAREEQKRNNHVRQYRRKKREFMVHRQRKHWVVGGLDAQLKANVNRN